MRITTAHYHRQDIDVAVTHQLLFTFSPVLLTLINLCVCVSS